MIATIAKIIAIAGKNVQQLLRSYENHSSAIVHRSDHREHCANDRWDRLQFYRLLDVFFSAIVAIVASIWKPALTDWNKERSQRSEVEKAIPLQKSASIV